MVPLFFFYLEKTAMTKLHELVILLNENVIPLELQRGSLYKSLVSASLVLANHPSAMSREHYMKCFWRMHGYIDCKSEMGQWIPETESKMRILLVRLNDLLTT